MSRLCECGRGPVVVPPPVQRQGLAPDEYGCADCNALDGTTGAQRAVIGALRLADRPLTIIEVAAELDWNRLRAERRLHQMVKRGQLRKRLSELDCVDGFGFGGGASSVAVAMFGLPGGCA